MADFTFDGNGIITFGSNITLPADFVINLPTFTPDVSGNTILGSSAASSLGNLIIYTDSMTLRTNDTNYPSGAMGFTLGNPVVGAVLSRTGTTVKIAYDGSDYVLSTSISGTIYFRGIGLYFGTNREFEGAVSGEMTVYSAGSLIHTYDFESYTDPDVLTDSTGTNDGALSGFTTGGFAITGTTSSLVINTANDLPVSGDFDVHAIRLDVNGDAELVTTISATFVDGSSTVLLPIADFPVGATVNWNFVDTVNSLGANANQVTVES